MYCSFTQTVSYDIQFVMELKIPIFGGEGLFFVNCEKKKKKFGFRRFLSADWQENFINMHIPSGRREEGSVLENRNMPMETDFNI